MLARWPSPVTTAAFVAVMFAFVGAPAIAQSVLVGGGLQADLQRFSGNPGLNVLDGTGIGWTVVASASLWPHVVIRLEGSSTAPIESTQSTSLDVEGRLLTIRSTYTHDTRSIAPLAGYTHRLSSRVQASYLGGMSFARVRRTFITNAASLILPTPAADATTFIDDFTVFMVGGDLLVRLVPHVGVLLGVRAQALKLQPDLSGYSVRPFIAATWAF